MSSVPERDLSAREKVGAKALAAPKPKRRRAKRRILVVDDNTSAAESLATLLEVMGNETCQAHDGLEAIDAAMKFLPDVVVLDISLPKLDGCDAARVIRERLGGSAPYLIALSGWERDGDERLRQAGFDAYLTKPVEMDTLRSLLASRLNE